MARPPKPIEKHLAEGTYRADRHGPVADEDGSCAPPEKPGGMWPVAASFWDHVTELLKGVVRERDGPQLEQLCSWWALWQQTEVQLMDMEAGTLEYVRTLTAVSVASQNFDRIAKRFGLTPADRALLKAERSGPPRPKVATKPPTALDKKGSPTKGKKK